MGEKGWNGGEGIWRIHNEKINREGEKKQKNKRHSKNLEEMMLPTDNEDQYVTKKEEAKNLIHEQKKV